MNRLKLMCFVMIFLSSLLVCSCGKPERALEKKIDLVEILKATGERCSNINDSIQRIVWRNTPVTLFGVKTLRDDLSIIKNLSDANVIKVDTIHMEEGEFKSAVIELAGVKFGMNQSGIFFTSRHDNKAVKSLIKFISKYYGEPEVDGNDDEELAYNYYHWNLYQQKPEDPYIRIRPAHSEKGGLTMMWNF